MATKEAKKMPKPRTGYYYGQRTTADYRTNRNGQWTWLEPEELCYPDGAQTRRCYALCEDGIRRVVWCGIPDTYFSIPAHTKIKRKYVAGYVGSNEDGYFFHAIERN